MPQGVLNGMQNILWVLVFCIAFSLILFLAIHLKNFNQENPGGNQASMKYFSWNNFNGCYMVITILSLALTAGIID